MINFYNIDDFSLDCEGLGMNDDLFEYVDLIKNRTKTEEYYYTEWKLNEVISFGNKEYAAYCKQEYKKLVMKSIIKEYHFYSEKTKMFPTVVLN